MRELICAGLSAVLFYFSQGVADAWLLTWIAPTPLLWLAFGNTPAWRLALASFVAYLAGQIYILQCYDDAPPMVLAIIFGLRPILFPFAILFARFGRRGCGAFCALLAFPACWTAADYAVSLLSRHGTYGSIAYSEMSAPVVLQSASLLGMYSVTFILCLFASALALAARGGRTAFVAAGAGLALCAVDIGFGTARLLEPQSSVLRVAALAETRLADQDDVLGPDVDASSVLASAVRDLGERGAKLIVAPEESLATRREWRQEVFAPLQVASTQTGARIVAGFHERAPFGDIATAFSPDGSSRVYAKRHLLLPIEAQFTPGIAPGILGDGMAMEICKDMDFPETIRQDARTGLNLVAVPAWDFGTDAWLHARLAIMRGVENGFALVRAANNGLLTASDAHGRLIASKAVDTDQLVWILADLPLGPGPTLYTHIGDVFPWTCLALTFVLAAAGIIGRMSRSANTKT
ncbi:nitrilase-related carbon-nitrogen hydrolase [Paucibacter sp. R3-3]|uniref:Nitrilase-related carbon-nitrogen hydrolase n=1 Tax=Roseateles agri TaxID=3098619 RepID=A0ABU5DKT7_9BURK|nr:nitrilase-related carbon-nitrogen hydrolase [Paucibacter sp. R3-3]MDY0746897.1 nitrilase-related carbon-nitrogen hydrolase [Paucibacter sp. R3-3]